MRSKAIKLDVQFAEAKANGRLDGKFAVTCLALLRQTCSKHIQSELLASIADSLEELIFSHVPSFEEESPRGEPSERSLAWLELYKRAQEEKREEAMAKEALLLERQQLLDRVDEADLEDVARAAREAAVVAREAEAVAREDAARAVHANELAAIDLREAELRESQQSQLEVAAKRLALSEGSLLRAQMKIGVVERASTRREEGAALASATLREQSAAAPPPPPPHAATAARLQAQLRALQLQLLCTVEPGAEDAATSEVARLCEVEADGCVARGAIAGTARADEVQQLLARYILDLQPPAPAVEKPPGGSLQEQLMQEKSLRGRS